jgi:hypothetical protein
MDEGGTELMVDTQKFPVGNPAFDPLKLKTGKKRKN